MRPAVLVVVTALAGCVDSIPPPPMLDAHTMFVQTAWPALSSCVGCHAAQPTIDFLAPGTAEGAYTTVLAFQPPVVNLARPEASLLVTMGKHTGPALEMASYDSIMPWIAQERQQVMPSPAPTTEIGPIDLQLGTPATIDLPADAHLAFVASALSGGLDLSHLAITAGPLGLHVVHPLFVTHPAKLAPVVDALDRFGDVDIRLGAGESLTLGGSDVLFLDFDPASPLTIHFLTLEAP